MTAARAVLAGVASALLLALAGCGSAGSAGTATASVAGSSGTGSASEGTDPSASSSASSAVETSTPGASAAGAADGQLHGLVAVWPFTTAAEVSRWQQEYRSGGSQPWHLDPGRTALSFSSGRLGYREVNLVTSSKVAGDDARIGVGWKNPNDRPATVAVLHLLRWGTGADRPWVVVGSDDATLSLTAPRYGATVGSPLKVGGVITGVDESLHVLVFAAGVEKPVGEQAGMPAGGEKTPWNGQVTFAAPHGSLLTVAVSTGGHLMAVEQFAITAVRVA